MITDHSPRKRLTRAEFLRKLASYTRFEVWWLDPAKPGTTPKPIGARRFESVHSSYVQLSKLDRDGNRVGPTRSNLSAGDTYYETGTGILIQTEKVVNGCGCELWYEPKECQL